MEDFYDKGVKLKLQLLDHLGSKNETEAEIRSTYPFTYSCVMLVKLLDSTRMPSRVILRLHDRRFSNLARKGDDSHHRSGQCLWNQTIEAKYVDFVHSGAASQFISHLRASTARKYKGANAWTSLQYETWLYAQCDGRFKRELKAYSALKDYQGTLIPKFYNSVRLLGRLGLSHDFQPRKDMSYFK